MKNPKITAAFIIYFQLRQKGLNHWQAKAEIKKDFPLLNVNDFNYLRSRYESN